MEPSRRLRSLDKFRMIEFFEPLARQVSPRASTLITHHFLKQLLRIDVDLRLHIFGQRKRIEHLADVPA